MHSKIANATYTNVQTNRPLQLFSGLGRVHDMLALRRSRQDLSMLDDNQLRDIGISRSKAEEESNRPFWDLSAHWLTRR